MSNYRELEVWKMSMDLADESYALSKTFPRDEVYGLTSQLRRAAVSIPANIAEGSARNSANEFIQFIAIAYGSCCELETLIEIAKRQSYVSEMSFTEYMNRLSSISRMLKALKNSLKTSKAA